MYNLTHITQLCQSGISSLSRYVSTQYPKLIGYFSTISISRLLISTSIALGYTRVLLDTLNYAHHIPFASGIFLNGS